MKMRILTFIIIILAGMPQAVCRVNAAAAAPGDVILSFDIPCRYSFRPGFGRPEFLPRRLAKRSYLQTFI